MKNILITFILMMCLTVSADESLIWKISNGAIIGHGDTINYDGISVQCGETRLGGVKTNAVSAGTVVTWVDGSKNISELGVVTVVEWLDLYSAPSFADPSIQAILNTIAEMHNKTPQYVYDIYAGIKKTKKPKKPKKK